MDFSHEKLLGKKSINFLEYRIGTESDILYLLDKVKRRIEFFDKDRLYEDYLANKGHREDVYDQYVRRYLFDQGVDYPFSQPRSASGAADIVSGLETDDPYFLVMNLSDHNLHMPSDEDAQMWPPRLHAAGVTVYMVVIRTKPLPSASKHGKQTTKHVVRGDLIRS